MLDQYKKVMRYAVLKRSLYLWLLVICVFAILFSLHTEYNDSENEIKSVRYGSFPSTDEEQTTEFLRREFITKGDFSTHIDSLNNTRNADSEILFFNRVPKVGSQTFMELLKRLSDRNDFIFQRDAVQRVEMIRLGVRQQHDLVRMVSDLPSPTVYIKHVCYTNFTRFRKPKPIYVNVVRDPVERVISWFYYIRAPWYFVERKKSFPDLPLPEPSWLRKDFEECVLSGDPECVYHQGAVREGINDHRRQSLFFCGHDHHCLPFNTQGALERAKRAVENEYAVVGVLEDLNVTLKVLENYIPRFFTGASNVYYENTFNAINTNSFKRPVSEMVKDIVRKNFTKEIEFYEFCRQRLHKQYAALNLV